MEHKNDEYSFVKYDNFNPFTHEGPTPRIRLTIERSHANVEIVEATPQTENYETLKSLRHDLLKRLDYFKAETRRMEVALRRLSRCYHIHCKGGKSGKSE